MNMTLFNMTPIKLIMVIALFLHKITSSGEQCIYNMDTYSVTQQAEYGSFADSKPIPNPCTNSDYLKISFKTMPLNDMYVRFSSSEYLYPGINSIIGPFSGISSVVFQTDPNNPTQDGWFRKLNTFKTPVNPQIPSEYSVEYSNDEISFSRFINGALNETVTFPNKAGFVKPNFITFSSWFGNITYTPLTFTCTKDCNSNGDTSSSSTSATYSSPTSTTYSSTMSSSTYFPTSTTTSSTISSSKYSSIPTPTTNTSKSTQSFKSTSSSKTSSTPQPTQYTQQQLLTLAPYNVPLFSFMNLPLIQNYYYFIPPMCKNYVLSFTADGTQQIGMDILNSLNPLRATAKLTLNRANLSLNTVLANLLNKFGTSTAIASGFNGIGVWQIEKRNGVLTLYLNGNRVTSVPYDFSGKMEYVKFSMSSYKQTNKVYLYCKYA
ncbi:hypothetical protein BB558_006046 [Smittium angustum]|uniref:Uncharacterized protein n=1 Tax=Smittium angustum TaxID=133377 RepID=A0A2U1IYV3_SMIAN|nr:hypothetical protein BB558_006046 [Smittium angustum]